MIRSKGIQPLSPGLPLYEFVNTRLARRKEDLYAFEQFIREPNVELLSDEVYKRAALDQVFVLNKERTASVSLVDEVMRQMIVDRELGIDYLITFNRKDFDHTCQLARVAIMD